jgi:CRISPR/Cas system-associated protein Cas10 (large subunit of type III CRISPR-Cas system)
MRDRILSLWDGFVDDTLRLLGPGLAPSEAVRSQAGRVFDISWSWVPEADGYGNAAILGARQFAESRRFRPFPPSAEEGEKCAICGERAALPDGNREHVHRAWRTAQADAERDPESKLAKFLHFEQGRLCLVCTTKRFFTYVERIRKGRFLAFDELQPSDDAPWFALLKMDGDRMGSILSRRPEEIAGGDLEEFHREVSLALSRFAEGLHLEHSNDLNLDELPGFQPKGREPQLLYAGEDDVLAVCDPRDALGLARVIRERYRKAFDSVRGRLPDGSDPFTLSGAVLFASPGHPAGLLFHDLEELLDDVAKTRAGRNAVALRLAKRGGPPVEVAFSWDGEAGWIGRLETLIEDVIQGDLTSGQTFNLRLGERTLMELFGKDESRWRAWLGDRLSRHEGTKSETLATRIAPFFAHGKPEALRIARFLGREARRGAQP